jgi:regulator of sigma E protease
MITAILFLIVLGVLVFVHEMGHFLVARYNGIKVDEFGFGFPPRLGGVVWDDASKRFHFVKGNREIVSPYTVYSFNWIPLGGFVKIKGEDGNGSDPDSFATKSTWVRIKVLSAGVAMNFLFAWIFISIVLMMGFPQAVDPTATTTDTSPTTIQISKVLPNTPAESMGLQFGDHILALNETRPENIKQVQEVIAFHKGQSLTFTIDRGDKTLILTGTPRTDYPANEGSLGIGLDQTRIIKASFFEAIQQGALATYHLTEAMLFGIGGIFKGLFTGTNEGLSAVSGPIGIAKMTGQVSSLGFVYLLYFAAILSINLGIINILPIPALDGGRIFFILIEIIKGSPVSKNVEGIFHSIGFLALLALMLLVTIHDLSNLRIF